MNIIAKRGDQYLVTEYSVTNGNPNPSGHIIDLSQKSATAMPVQQALKWGYWEEAGKVTEVIQQQIAMLISKSNLDNVTKAIQRI